MEKDTVFSGRAFISTKRTDVPSQMEGREFALSVESEDKSIER